MKVNQLIDADPGLAGDLLAGGSWKNTAPQRATLESGPDRNLFMSNGAKPTYLVHNGNSSDFAELSPAAGIAVPANGILFVDSEVERKVGSPVDIVLLEFDQDRKRTGEVSVPAGTFAKIQFGEKTAFILATLRVETTERLQINFIWLSSNSPSTRPSNIVLSPIQESAVHPIAAGLSLGRLSHGNLSRLDRVKIANAAKWLLLNGIEPPQRALDELGRKLSIASSDSKVRALFESRIFNPLFYQVASVAEFTSDEEAALDFLRRGMQRGLSCSPLIDVKNLPQNIQEDWKNGDLGKVLRYFRRPRTKQVDSSEFFSPRLVDAPLGVEEQHPGGMLGWFCENCRPETFVPSGRHTTRWDDFRSAISSGCVNELVTRRSRAPRFGGSHSFKDERQFKLQVLSWFENHDDKPLVSVIMPAWNREKAVVSAIHSVLQQSYSEWELIVVDDGSEDGTIAAARGFTDPRVKVVERPHLGVSSARNAGIDAAEGKYIAFLDSDNVWETDYLEIMVASMEKDQIEFAYAGLSFEVGGKTQYRMFPGLYGDLLVRNHTDMNVMVATKRLIRAAGMFDEELPRWVDYDLALRMAQTSLPVLVPIIGCIYDHSDTDEFRITAHEPPYWQSVVLDKAWNRDEQLTDEVVPDKITAIVSTKVHHDIVLRAVQSLLSEASGPDLEVIVVDNGAAFNSSWRLKAATASDGRVNVISLPREVTETVALNHAASFATGEFIYFMDSELRVRPHWDSPLRSLLEQQDVAAVQSLILAKDDSVYSAGLANVLPDRPPVRFLEMCPPETAQVDSYHFSTLCAQALAVRTTDFKAVQGFAARYVYDLRGADLCLRLANSGYGVARVSTGSIAYGIDLENMPTRRSEISDRRQFVETWSSELPNETNFYTRLGLQIADFDRDHVKAPTPKPILKASEDSPEIWGLRYAAGGGPRGDFWGDTAFVDSLRHSLEQQGKRVVTYRRGANERSINAIDHVNVVIRGLERISPFPGKINILWVISHSDDVSAEEMAGYDLVYAASEKWARKMTQRTGVEVRTLHQATDATRFNPRVVPDSKQRGPLFVGSVHPGRSRRIVETALAASAPITVIGKGWTQRLSSDTFEKEYVDNRELAAFYRSATHVLADHWTDMAEQGFIQNRIFDAVACGVPVVSDRVEGLEEMFGGAVQCYDSAADLKRLLSPEGAAEFPSRAEIEEIAEMVLRLHSFDARARTLISDAEQVQAQRQGWLNV